MNGYLNILKPPGMTSSNVVSMVRRVLQIKKVGHAGTLDPLAAGVLPIMIGRATKMFDYLNLDRKVYTTEFTFGLDTNTQDIEGEVLGRADKIPSEDDIRCIFSRFTGDILQTPPKISAISINGKRAYQLARAGAEFEMKPRAVTIYSIDMLRKTGEKSYLFRVECSKGTYIRSLCRDLAAELGTYAYVSFLIRDKSGYFAINESITLEQLEMLKESGEIEKYLIAVDKPIGHFSEIHVPIEKQSAVLNGAGIKTSDEDIENTRVYCGGEFIGIGSIKRGYLKIKKKFHE
ncbi:MAG: tRNA pseudouridine(55) synthase TruB [Clostridia bacterium]|nr:tRNA pseudouridine(55) synthase TruB [Clostridia bacterium]